ncbi:IclR family transcriptional regulator [Rhodococcus olei]|uniref:IclR family transcriptional regulator n=1 Tax=Rhodococcus olei TaxID=2161675 RepID=A0ABP8NWW8_9NOCA
MTSTAHPEAGAPASSLDRLSLVLNCFRSAPALSLTDLSRQTGIPRTSTLRMLERLVRMGWLRRRGTDYELGDALAEFGALSVYHRYLDRVVSPLLHELHDVTGHVVHLGVLDGADVLYLRKVGGLSAPETGTRAGSRIPARSSTIGKALLAAPPRTAGTSGDTRRHVDPAPRIPVAFGTCPSGLGCIGVRIGTLGGVQAGLSISGPVDHVRFDHRDAAPVRMAAAAIAQHLGFAEAARARSA